MDEQGFMLLALECAKKATDNGGQDPRVGAVAAKNGKVLATAYRGERDGHPGEHAEHVLVYHKMRDKTHELAGATVYTTLEPCTKRGRTKDGHEKTPCAKWLSESKVKRVVVGMWDPNQLICGKGCRMLREADITVEMFPHTLMTELEAMNSNWARNIRSKPVNRMVEQIFELAVDADYKSKRAQVNVASVLEHCLDTLRRGSILIGNGEAGYFARLQECVETAPQGEKLRAFIRLNTFDLGELRVTPAYYKFYSQLHEAVVKKNLVAEYTFLVKSRQPNADEQAFVDRYKQCTKIIRTIHLEHGGLPAERLHPSIVLLEQQGIVFTHDRAQERMFDAREWIKPEDFRRLQDQCRDIEYASTEYYRA